MECQSLRKPYSNIARWWEEKVFRCWKKEWRPWTQMKTKSINSWEWNRFMVSERKWCLKEEVSKRVKMMANTELNDANLIKAMNWRLYRLQPTQWKSAESMMLSWRNWIRWLRKNMLGWESRQVMNDCTWRERKAEEDWSRWGMLTKRKDCVSPATWPSRPTDGLKLHGEKRQLKRRMQSLWNGWRRWRKLEWDCAF